MKRPSGRGRTAPRGLGTTRLPFVALLLSFGLSVLAIPLAGAAADPDPNLPDPDLGPDSLPAAPVPGATDHYDPFEGVDENGRIPAALRPDGVQNPERWRYIPEGRIKPGNLLERFMVSSMIAPFVFADGDVGFGGGVALIDIDFRQQRRREFAGVFLSYTEKGQQNYSMVWRRWLHHLELPDGGVLQEERSFISGFAGYSRTLTRRFFGTGPGTDESDETSYTDDEIVAELAIERAFPNPGDDLVWGLGVRGEFHDLAGGEVSGEPDTRLVFPRLFSEADDAYLGWVSAGARWDTRDSQRNPYSGWHIGAEIATAAIQRDGDIGMIATLSGSKVVPVPGLLHDGGDAAEEHPPTDTLAFGLRSQLGAGNLPFLAEPTLGGSVAHRGFIDGRFRDRSSWLASAEYRFWVLPRGIPLTRTIRVERIGLAPFYEIGGVARDFAAFFEERVRHSYGVGLRITLERQAPFRVDFGFSEDGFNIAARFGLSF